MTAYQIRSMEGASPVGLVVALYDGMVRFLNEASSACDRGDVPARRSAVRKVFHIIAYLQSCLRPQVDENVAAVLGEYYAAMLAMSVRASHAASREQFSTVIANVLRVREAWCQVELEQHKAGSASALTAARHEEAAGAWTA